MKMDIEALKDITIGKKKIYKNKHAVIYHYFFLFSRLYSKQIITLDIVPCFGGHRKWPGYMSHSYLSKIELVSNSYT